MVTAGADRVFRNVAKWTCALRSGPRVCYQNKKGRAVILEFSSENTEARNVWPTAAYSLRTLDGRGTVCLGLGILHVGAAVDPAFQDQAVRVVLSRSEQSKRGSTAQSLLRFSVERSTITLA